jgi:hypothetical protein
VLSLISAESYERKRRVTIVRQSRRLGGKGQSAVQCCVVEAPPASPSARDFVLVLLVNPGETVTCWMDCEPERGASGWCTPIVVQQQEPRRDETYSVRPLLRMVNVCLPHLDHCVALSFRQVTVTGTSLGLGFRSDSSCNVVVNRVM